MRREKPKPAPKNPIRHVMIVFEDGSTATLNPHQDGEVSPGTSGQTGMSADALSMMSMIACLSRQEKHLFTGYKMEE